MEPSIIIKQLRELIEDRKAMCISDAERDEIYLKDIEALEAAIERIGANGKEAVQEPKHESTAEGKMTIETLASYHHTDQQTRDEIWRYITGIPDERTQKMFMLHFVCGKSYAHTAKLIGYTTKDCVHKRVKRYVKNHAW